MNSPSSILCAGTALCLSAGAATIPVSFQLRTSPNAVAVQFDVSSSGPVQFGSVSGDGLASHIVDSATVTGGGRRFLIYSTSNAPLSSSGTVDVTVTTSAPVATSGFLTISASDVLATNASGNTEAPAATASPNALPVALSVSPASFLAAPSGSSPAWAVEALDPDGQVASVTFSLNGTNQATDTTAPFGGTWNATAAGDFASAFTITDNRNAQVPAGPGSIIRVFSSNPFASYPAFQSTFFLPGTDPAKTADPYSIGLPNLAAFALGLNPTSPDRNLYPAWTIESDPTGRYAVYRAVVRTVAGLASDFQVSRTMAPGSWQAPQAAWLRSTPWPAPAIFIARQPSPTQNGAVWKYNEGLIAAAVQGTATWKDPTFNDAAWPSGPAQLGVGETDQRTSLAGNPANLTGGTRRPYNTSYFRKTFNVSDPSIYSNLQLDLLRDDGAIIWINGVKAWTTNLPATGTIDHNTPAILAIQGGDETTYINNVNAPGSNATVTTIPASLLVPGSNLIAVEIHQSDILTPTSQTTSSDLSFDLELTANPVPGLTQQELRIPIGPAPAPRLFARLRFTLP